MHFKSLRKEQIFEFYMQLYIWAWLFVCVSERERERMHYMHSCMEARG